MKIATKIKRLLLQAFNAGRAYETWLHFQDPTKKKPDCDKWIKENTNKIDKFCDDSLPKGYCCKYCGSKTLENQEGNLIKLK